VTAKRGGGARVRGKKRVGRANASHFISSQSPVWGFRNQRRLGRWLKLLGRPCATQPSVHYNNCWAAHAQHNPAFIITCWAAHTQHNPAFIITVGRPCATQPSVHYNMLGRPCATQPSVHGLKLLGRPCATQPSVHYNRLAFGMGINRFGLS
jgi:hypothetical protein